MTRSPGRRSRSESVREIPSRVSATKAHARVRKPAVLWPTMQEHLLSATCCPTFLSVPQPGASSARWLVLIGQFWRTGATAGEA